MKTIFRFKTDSAGKVTMPKDAEVTGIFLGQGVTPAPEGSETAEEGEQESYLALEIYAVVDMDKVVDDAERIFAVCATGETVPDGSDFITTKKPGRGPAAQFWEIPATDEGREWVKTNGGVCYKAS